MALFAGNKLDCVLAHWHLALTHLYGHRWCEIELNENVSCYSNDAMCYGSTRLPSLMLLPMSVLNSANPGTRSSSNPSYGTLSCDGS